MSDEEARKAITAARKFAAKPKNDGDKIVFVRMGEAEMSEEKDQKGRDCIWFPVEYDGSEGKKILSFPVTDRTADVVLKAKVVGGKVEIERVGVGDRTTWRARVIE